MAPAQRLGATLARLKPTDLEVALRAALAAVIPLTVLLALDRMDWAAYASFGAMTALYGRREPYRMRARSVGVAGTALVTSIGFGILAAVAGSPLWLVAVTLAVVVAGGIALAARFGLFPATPLFFVFGFLICAEVPTPADEALVRLGIAVVAAAFAITLSLSGWMLRRILPGSGGVFASLDRRPAPRHDVLRSPAVLVSMLQSLLGVAVAGAVVLLLGVGHPAWAIVSVVAVIPPPGAPHSVSRSVHRIVGTALGVLVAAAVLLPGPPAWMLIAVVGVCQFATEILVGRHYGAALLFITPLALAVSELAAPTAIPGLLVDRVVATTIGAGVGLLTVLLARAIERRRT